jgi:Domain of unknown function (DUF4252)
MSPLIRVLTLFAVTLLAGCLPAMAFAAGPRLKLPEFEHLRELATQSVNLSIGGWPLGLAARIADSDNDPEDAEFRELLHGLKGIYIRSYEFASDNMYPSADVEAVRAQLSAPDWSPVAQIRSGHEGEKVDIYLCLSGEKVSGVALVASGPREFTIINVVGAIDIQRLATLERRFGVRHPGD